MQRSNFKCEMSISATWYVDWHTQVRHPAKGFCISLSVQMKLPKCIELDVNSILSGELIWIDFPIESICSQVYCLIVLVKVQRQCR